ncbi:hypothetical protein BEWA_007980 [Theileria equi strain WA]|uniref:Protein unc-45 homolog B n=1 Tax=Theileria equi strain WA TaxID=1537102 RepID=L0B2S0_THEEQ|nr:hypothetical protein BEWA_007980 [Theileria equi strain WA]AFZ81389.1 hypothetical protein BEWA_007980 [Theileria equi strain WA]|eukprot:XP_004831055.1 hypothetical protein BEWA_007980 [Theileria equi strain WA]
MSDRSMRTYLDEKEVANEHFRAGEYLEASSLYTHTICKILEIKDENVSSIKECIDTYSYNLESQESRQFLSTLLCNLALCYSNLKMKEKMQILCETCLCVDDSNYKAAYHLAFHHLSTKEYNASLKYIQKCQQIVNGNFSLWKDKKQPHLDLVETLRRSIGKTGKAATTDCSIILRDILNGNALNLNIQRLLLVSPNELIKHDVFAKLVNLCCSKISEGIIDDTLANLWSVLYQLLYGSGDKNRSDLCKSFNASLVGKTVIVHVTEIFKLLEKSKSVSDTTKCTILEQSLTNITKLCSLLRTSESLEILYTLLDGANHKLEQQVLAAILVFFSEIGSISASSKFNVALAKILEHLISICDVENDIYKAQQLDACLIAIFKAGFGTDEIAVDAFGNLISRLANAYITKSANMDEHEGITLQPTWYIIVKSLFIANKPIFKSYIIANDIIRSLLVNFFRPNPSECSTELLQMYASQVIVNCMDFAEFRQQFIDFVLYETFLDHLTNGVKFVSFITKLGNAKDGHNYTSACPLQEYILLMLSKLSIHSIELKEEIVIRVNLFKILPNLLLLNMDKGYPIETSLECISYLSLHKEFKTANFSFIPPLLLFVERGGNNKVLLMACQIIVNLLRGNKDRSKFLNTNTVYDKEQLEALKNLQEKLPEMAKATINGHYFEGDHDMALKTRHYLFLIQENILASSMIKLSKKIEDKANPIYMLIIESLHYLALEQSHRRIMQSMGVLRIFINYATSNVNKDSSAFKHVSQSIAHICIAITPSNLSYNDAIDAVQPLVILLGDENEMFQYESAMALTNLLSINDDIKRRVFGLKGWQLFGNLIYSDNDMLKTVGLEGWCNLSAGEDVVHGFIYSQIIGQFLARDKESAFELNHADLNILLAFALEFNNEAAVTASTGALALLTRDLRIAQYIIFAKRFENILKALNAASSVPILHRILTILSCVSQAELKDAEEADKIHEKYIKELIKTEIKKNSHKYINKTLADLAAEI